MKQSKSATYTFEEMLDRIAKAQDKEELDLLTDLIYEEKTEYALFYLKVLIGALGVKRGFLNEKL